MAGGRAPGIAPILAVNFVGTLGFSIVLPFLVYVVTRLGGNALVFGVMGATYSAFQLVGAPILGRWSDRHGRKKILLLSQAGTAISWAVFLGALALPATPMLAVDSPVLGAFTLTVPLVVLFVARALDGVTGGNISVANAYLADVTTDADRAKNFGRLAVSGNLGFVVGPALAGVLGATPWGDTLPVIAALVISAVACAMIAFGLHEVPACDPRRVPERKGVARGLGQEVKDCVDRGPAEKVPLRTVLAMPLVPRLLLLNLLVYLAFNFFYVAFPMHVAQDLGWPIASTGVFFSVVSVLMVVVQGPVLARASQRWSPRALVIGGGVLLAASFPFFGARGAVPIYAGAALLALGNGLMWPSLLALLSQAAGSRVQGAVQGLAGSGGALASIVGLVVGGSLFGWMGAGVFVTAAVITGVACVISLGIPRAAPA
ncbi:MAG: MFS transporter [Gemmatimonadota bacterium]|nr:MFS transporter [Gemmatimonadota bacterium]